MKDKDIFIDPVCNMKVTPMTSSGMAIVNGEKFYSVQPIAYIPFRKIQIGSYTRKQRILLHAHTAIPKLLQKNHQNRKMLEKLEPEYIHALCIQMF